MPNKNKAKGNAWERDVVEYLIERIGGSKVKRIAGSGALGTQLDEPELTGDIRAKFIGFPRAFRLEAKVGYGGDSYLTFQREWLNKIIREASQTNSYPAVICKFSNSRKAGGVKYFVALDIDTFCDIINYVDDLREELDKDYGETKPT